jgi:hypothetical protein
MAAAVGYNTLTYGPHVTIGDNWLKAFDNNSVQNPDGSVSLYGPWHYGENLTTLGRKLFGGGGYFEATFRFDNPSAGWSDAGWCCWWGNTFEGSSFGWVNGVRTRGVEVDFYEMLGGDNQYNAGFHDWYQAANGSVADDGAGGQYTMPAGQDGHSLHRYGCLWVPATNTTKGYLEYYFDGVPWQRQSWDKYNPNSPAPYQQGTTAAAILDIQHLYLDLGNAPANPMHITKVEVWQRDGTQNLPPTGTSTVAAPPQAAEVGYNTRTYGPNVTLGVNWDIAFAGAHVTQNADGSVTAGGPAHFSDHVNTHDRQAFGGGAYFEATFSFTGGAPVWDPSVGWPCWWANSLEGRTLPFPDRRGIEIDFAEMLKGTHDTFTANIFDWYDRAAPTYYQAETTGEVRVPTGTSHNPHKYGCLWVPATATTKGYCKFYVDDILITQWIPTWNRYYDNQPVPYQSGTTLFSNMDVQHFYLIFGSGDPWPMTVTDVSVWQRDGTQNLPPSGAVATVSISTISNKTAGVPFTVTGTLANFGSTPTLQYRANNTGSWLSLPSGASVSTTAYSFTAPGMVANSAAVISVRDSSTLNSATSNAFAVTGVVSTEVLTINTIANQTAGVTFAITGTISGVTSAPTLQYRDDAGSWLSLPGGSTVSSSAFSFTHPALSVTSTSPTTFTDDFTSYRPANWFYNQYDEASDTSWVNSPTVLGQIYNYTGGRLNLMLLNTGSTGLTSKPFISGVMDTIGASGAFQQEYGYWEVTVAVDRLVGLTWDFVILSYTATPFSAFTIRISTDASNVQHLEFFDYTSVNYYETNSNNGLDPSIPHTYGMDWQAGYLRWYIDGVLTVSYASPYVGIGPFYFKTRCASNYNPAFGTPVVNTAALPKGAHIDQVSVWTTKPAAPGSRTVSVRDANNTSVTSTSNVFLVSAAPAGVLAIGNIATQQAGVAFTVSGTISGVSSAPTLQYRDDSGTWLSLTVGATVTATAFSFSHPGMAAGSHTVSIRDAVTTSITVTSNSFSVTAQPVETITIATIASQTASAPFTVSGTITNTTAMPILQYSNNNGSTWTALPGGSTVSTTAFSFTNPGLPASASARVMVREQNTPTISATSNAFVVNALPVEAITVDTISTRTTGATFAVTGTVANAPTSLTLVLQYQDNGGNWNSANATTNLTAGSGTYTFTHPAMSAALSNTIAVRDAANTGVVGTSNAFRVRLPESANNTVVTTVGPYIVNTIGEVWTITSTGQIAVDGVVDVPTNSVTVLAYVGGRVYQQAHAGLWWSKAVSSDSWTPTEGSAVSPLPAETLAVNTVAGQLVNIAFTVTGTISAALVIPTLQYRVGAGTWLAFPSNATVTTGAFSFVVPGIAVAGSTTVGVRDANNTSISATSNTFAVLSISATLSVNTIPTQNAGYAFLVRGTISGATAAPALDYIDPNGAWRPLPTGSTVTTNTFSFTHPGVSAAQGFYVTVRLRDKPSVSAASAPFRVSGPESQNNTVIVTPGPQITDALGNAYTITLTGEVAINGIADLTTSSVVAIAYVSRTAWFENADQQWWSRTTVGAWTPIGGSPLGPVPSSKPTIYLTSLAPLAVVPGFTIPVPGIVVNDTVVSGTFKVTLSCLLGTASMPGAQGSGTAFVTASGSMTLINTYLRSLTFTGETVGDGGVTVTIRDAAGQTATAFVPISVPREAPALEIDETPDT